MPPRSAANWRSTGSAPVPKPYWEYRMTRTRKFAGHVSFVGAGPGDPGLLTRRAYDALRSADHVVYDRAVPEPLLAAVQGYSADAVENGDRVELAEFSPAEGASGDVAKVL